MATEHALLDDNGDGLGTPATWFRGVRATKSAKDGATLDGLRANQFHLVRNSLERDMSPSMRARRDELERRLEQLRARKGELTAAVYDERLENVLRPLADLYAELEETPPDPKAKRDGK